MNNWTVVIIVVGAIVVVSILAGTKTFNNLLTKKGTNGATATPESMPAA